ncbi:B-4DMT family transporter [Prescottella subtropica]|uniref:B-4DMT family transporter n=1 Tax=Prescottella subtropica TaxID=2545757 RepID=UPI0010FA381B|nr:B-4DMT family transporter [Prescottella subtropica]
MNGWVVRGLGLAVVYVVVRTFLGAAVTQWPEQGSVMRWFSLVLVILAAFLWGAFDGIRDRRADPDPDHGADLTMPWLKAAFVAGILGGVAAWLVGMLFDIAVTSNGLLFEVTSGAAFTVLLVFVPAMIGVALGRLVAGRDTGKTGTGVPVAADADLEDTTAANYADSEWSYEHDADDTDTEVFAPVDPNGTTGGSHRADR